MSKRKESRQRAEPEDTSLKMRVEDMKLPVVKAFNPFKVRPLPGQIRERFFGIEDLAGSINAVGQTTPVLVTEISENPKFDAQLVDGERRLRACKHLRVPVMAFIWDGKTDPEDIYARSVAANFGRQAHDCIEISKAVQRFKNNGKTVEEISNIFGKSVAWVNQHYSLRTLDPMVQGWLIPRVVDEKKKSDEGLLSSESRKIKAPLSFSLALLLVSLPAQMQIAAGRNIIADNMSLVEARRHILNLSRGSGHLVRHRSPKEQLETFLSVSRRVGHMVGIYNDMPSDEFDGMLGNVTPHDLARIKKSLDKTAEEISGLAECIQDEIDKRTGPQAQIA